MRSGSGMSDRTFPDGNGSGPCTLPPRAAARRDRVIDAARQLFACNGFHNTGIAQIARESGVLVGQIYRDFASKEDIVIAITQRDTHDFLHDQELRRALEVRDTAALRRWIARFIAGEEKATDRRLVAEIIAEASRSPRIAAIARHIHQSVRRDMGAALECLAPGAHLAKRREMLTEVILTISGGVFHRRLTDGDETTEPVVAALVEGVERRIDALAQER